MRAHSGYQLVDAVPRHDRPGFRCHLRGGGSEPEFRQHTAIPRNNGELGDPNNPSDHVKAIAFTAGFHFAFIEQGGTSLYATLAQKVTGPEVLRILLGIGGSEIMHFQTWQDKAGNATPLTDFDPVNNSSVTFTDLAAGQPETLQANLIVRSRASLSARNSLPAPSFARPSGTVGRGRRHQQLHHRRPFRRSAESLYRHAPRHGGGGR